MVYKVFATLSSNGAVHRERNISTLHSVLTLQDTLGAAVSAAAGAGAECEVDPARAGGAAALRRQQAALRDAVSMAWAAIAASAPRFPPPLRDCFATFRERYVGFVINLIEMTSFRD